MVWREEGSPGETMTTERHEKLNLYLGIYSKGIVLIRCDTVTTCLILCSTWCPSLLINWRIKIGIWLIHVN